MPKSAEIKKLPEISREEHIQLLWRQLTPEGQRFAKKLEQELARECAILGNDGAEAIRGAVTRHHLTNLDSVKTINRLASARKPPFSVCCFMIMNYAGILLSSGDHHRAKGELNATGQQLLQIWRIYANKLIDIGEEAGAHIDKEEKSLLAAIEKAGMPTFSLLGAVRSVFKK